MWQRNYNKLSYLEQFRHILTLTSRSDSMLQAILHIKLIFSPPQWSHITPCLAAVHVRGWGNPCANAGLCIKEQPPSRACTARLWPQHRLNTWPPRVNWKPGRGGDLSIPPQPPLFVTIAKLKNWSLSFSHTGTRTEPQTIIAKVVLNQALLLYWRNRSQHNRQNSTKWANTWQWEQWAFTWCGK